MKVVVSIILLKSNKRLTDENVFYQHLHIITPTQTNPVVCNITMHVSYNYIIGNQKCVGIFVSYLSAQFEFQIENNYIKRILYNRYKTNHAMEKNFLRKYILKKF